MISVIVPVYNREKYLKQCIDSILYQDYKEIELILVDDGSTDSSPAICDEYAKKDKRIKVIHKQNAGPGAARNSGINIAKGEYIAFVDSDDIVEPDIYSYLLPLIEQHQADFATYQNVFSFYDDQETPKVYDYSFSVHDGCEVFKSRMSTKSLISDSPCDKLFKRHIFDEIRFPEDRIVTEDTAIIYKILSIASKIVIVKQGGYNIRIHDTSVSRSSYNKRQCAGIKTYFEMIDFLKQKEEYHQYIQIAINYIIGTIYFNAGEMYNVNFEDKKETVKYVRNSAKIVLNLHSNLSIKNKVLLWIIRLSPNTFGMIYKITKKV